MLNIRFFYSPSLFDKEGFCATFFGKELLLLNNLNELKPISQKNRLYYLDFLRIIATLGVISIHISVGYDNSDNPYVLINMF